MIPRSAMQAMEASALVCCLVRRLPITASSVAATVGNAGTPNAKPGTGGSGVYVPVGADLINNSAIHGGGGGQGYTDGASDAASGAGVYLNGGTLVNEGQITGFLYKVGFDYAEYNRTNPLPPGVGVDVASGLFNNNDDAVVQDGVELQDGLVNNYNKIYGHQADYFGALQPTGNGGAGLIQSGGTFNNTYLISGGFGTPYKYEPGGAGVALLRWHSKQYWSNRSRAWGRNILT